MALELQLNPVQNQIGENLVPRQRVSSHGRSTMASENPGGATGTMDPVDIEYLEWDPEGSPVSIHMNPGVADGIAHDAIEGLEKEVGGLLLGRVVAGPHAAVWIERYQRISCDHTSGPEFILDSGEIATLEAAAANILATGELAVVGLYRSHTRPGFQLAEPDFDLIRRYFNDSSDLILLIKPERASHITGQFHAWDKVSGAHAVGGEFPFRGNMLKDESEVAAIPQVSEPPREHPRRLVPDFVPSPVEPSPSLYGLGAAPEPFARPEELTVEHGTRDRLKKWWPLLAALALVGGVLWFLLQPGRHGSSGPAPAQTAEAVRPLGLYVDPAGQTWRVSWNPNATALHEARSVQLFVREGEDQKRFDLSARDLTSGSYQYSPVAGDVTFRLEVVDKTGRISAESFRLMRAANPPAPAPAPKAVPSPATQPKAIYRAPPTVAAGIRSRIKGTVSIDVRVQIDARGHVASATPVTRQNSGLDKYLAGRAVQAARLWRFEPARENGKPVAGTQILHFVFDK
jgi:hypothetical protein